MYDIVHTADPIPSVNLGTGQGAAVPTNEEPTPRQSYIHVTTSLEQQRLERRTAVRSAAFFLPHLSAGMRVLDLGCGPGSITVGLAELVAPGEVVGIDFQPAQVERARALAAERNVTNVRFEVGDVYRLPYPDESFDAAFAHTLLLHLRDRSGALREIRRVLRASGLIGICDDDHGARLIAPPTPGLEQAWELFLKAVQHHGGDPFYARSQRSLLQDAGFACTQGYASTASGGCWASEDDTRFWAEWMVEQLRMPAFRDLLVNQGWADPLEIDAMTVAILAWGDRSDAYATVVSPAAIGWVTKPG